MLAYYAERLSAVEINNTFYRMPRREVVESWAQLGARVVPLRGEGEPAHHAPEAARGRRGRARLSARPARAARRRGSASLLVQLPPNLPVDLARLERFLDHLAARVRAAFEFRHASWLAEPVLACLRDRGAALVAVGDRRGAGRAPRRRRASATCACAAPTTAPAISPTGSRACARWPGTRRTCSSSTRCRGPRSRRSSPRSRSRGRAIPVRRDERAREVG